MAAIIDCIYPEFVKHQNEIVDKVNEHVVLLFSEEERSYLSSNSISRDENNYDTNNDAFSIEFHNLIHASGIQNHKLKLKVSAPIMLLRNLDQSSRLCNGTYCLIIKAIALYKQL
ncbi:uncharacterized protein LOC130805580 [Amaranthus tricolor]|uniref:uncharacterized protein LOC130805580 n=1 Tax=Amaranthus tricolor TaxID=29722 RepID=UPI00258A48E0|nr:uncharacterized protein LOC130805580 [Amaranthus tricolor]